MPKTLFSLLVFLCLLIGCKGTKSSQTQLLNQGIEGYVYETSGNQMPATNFKASTNRKPIITKVYVFAPTNINQATPPNGKPFFQKVNTQLIDSVSTDINGRFQIKLPTGCYSIFVKHADILYANRFDEQNNINLYRVESNNMTPATIVISEAATF